jgi:hypothetical protein
VSRQSRGISSDLAVLILPEKLNRCKSHFGSSGALPEIVRALRRDLIPNGEAMLADQFLEAAAAAKNTPAIDEIARLTWKAQVEGCLAYSDAEAVSAALQACRAAFAAGTELRLAKPVLGPPRPTRRRPRSPDRRASIERRRRHGAEHDDGTARTARQGIFRASGS